MSNISRATRIGLLMLASAFLHYWLSHHTEVSTADGLRYIRQAQRIDRGDLAGGLIRSIDHPMHPMAIVAAHEVLGGDGPLAWQAAAQAASVVMLVLAVVPLYLLGLELFERDDSATLGCVLMMSGPVASDVAVNVLSETTFLLAWTWGLWASARFLRNGRSGWLIPAVGFGSIAYFTRPEGLLIHLGLVGSLLSLPFLRGIQILWRRWLSAMAVLVLGPVVLVGPYMAAKGSVATKPALARLIGTEPEAPPEALEREGPLDPNQSTWLTYAIAADRVVRAVRGAVSIPMLPLSFLGLLMVFRRLGRRRARAWLFTGIVSLIALAGLVRLHATGGYCTFRHALIPGMILALAAGHAIAGLLQSISFEGRLIGLPEGRVKPGPAIWAIVTLALVAVPMLVRMKPYNSSFAPYRMAGAWLRSRDDAEGKVLDLTDWTLYFSGRGGAGFPKVLEAVGRPSTRFLVLQDAQLDGHLYYNKLVQQRIAGRTPVVRFPDDPGPRQIRVSVYDLETPSSDSFAEGQTDQGRLVR